MHTTPLVQEAKDAAHRKVATHVAISGFEEMPVLGGSSHLDPLSIAQFTQCLFVYVPYTELLEARLNSHCPGQGDKLGDACSRWQQPTRI